MKMASLLKWRLAALAESKKRKRLVIGKWRLAAPAVLALAEKKGYNRMNFECQCFKSILKIQFSNK